MGTGRASIHRPGMQWTSSLTVVLLMLVSAQSARIFRNPEPHLPAENLPLIGDQRTYTEIHAPASDARSAAEDDSYFAPGAWRPVRDPDFSSSGRRRVSSLAASGHGGDLQVASARNLHLQDGKSTDFAEARTQPPQSANSPTTTLGHSIALVANQLLQGSDIIESRSPEGSTTTSINTGSWPQASLDVRTPPQLMLQISGQKKAENSEEPKKNVQPIPNDPMGENFFPSRRHPPGATQHTVTTPGVTVTQMTVSTAMAKEGDQKLPLSTPTVTSTDNKKEEKRPLTSSTIYNKKPLTSSTATTPISTSTTPASVRWKIAIPPNRPARFPPRKPVTQQGSASPVISNNEFSKKDSKPTNSGSTNLRPSITSGGNTKPTSFLESSRQPTPASVKDVTTRRPVPITPPSVTKSTTTSTPVSQTTTTTITQTTEATVPSRPTTTTTSRPTTTTQPKQTESTTTALPNKEVAAVIQPKKPLPAEKEIVSEAKVTEVIKTDTSIPLENKEDTPSTTTVRPRRPNNKRKKNKNRRRRPSKKPSSSSQAEASSPLGTELEVKETPQEESTGNIASPLSTRIYNFIAREVMPSMSVGLLGLVVTAGLAGYFLLPTLGGLQRRSDVATDGLMTGYSGATSYGSDQEGDGGIMTSIFQNVMASVRNGEKEFERGPRRRRRSVISADEAENEVDTTLQIKDKDGQKTHLMYSTTPLSTDKPLNKDTTTIDHSTDNPTTPLGDTVTEGSIVSNDVFTTTEEAVKNDTPMQDLNPTIVWDGQYNDNPFSLMGILRRIADFKIRLGVGLLRATTDVIARYLEDVQHRLRDSDKHEWLRSLGSTVRRIGRSIDPPRVDSEDDSNSSYPRKRFSRHVRTRRHG